MTLQVKVFAALAVVTCVFAQGKEIGQSCILRNGIEGICDSVQNCKSAQKDLIKKVTPISCGFNNTTPIVCCEKQSLAKTPRISERKCTEYRRLGTYYPISLIVGGGGVDAEPKEFPHMSLLGYGKNGAIEFQCGGSLISEQFVLTAAHCLESRELGPVKVVRIGDLDTATDKDDAAPQDFSVINTYPHPDYTSLSHYNDIAILKLNKPVNITTYVKPACLQTEFDFDRDRRLTATGWGALFYGGDMHNKLQKLDLTSLEKEKCLPTYKPQKMLLNGIDIASQICGGNLEKSVDTCQGDSGGPLQYRIQSIPPVHKVVGVTAFGKHCNLVPGVYTRVSKYISWIESVVWPNSN